jgi:FkbM family methyltransferase
MSFTLRNDLLLGLLRHFPIDHGKDRLARFVQLPKEPVIYTDPSGIIWHLDPGDHVMRQLFLHGQYERNTLRHLKKLSRPTDLFVDVGANIGAYSLVMSRELSKGHVLSFEPNPRTLKFLYKNIALNHFGNISVEPIGLSDKPGSMTLFTPSLTQASLHKHKGSTEQENIRLTTLDQYCSDNDIRSIDILKVDIEGHEVNFLKGAQEIISRSDRMILVMEIDDNCTNVGKSKNDLLHQILNLGFRAFKPTAFPFAMKEILDLEEDYRDNIIFIKKERDLGDEHSTGNLIQRSRTHERDRRTS